MNTPVEILLTVALTIASLITTRNARADGPADAAAWETCRSRGKIYAECGRNVSHLVQAWIDLKQDPKTHLYSRAQTWDYHNEAADHYSSLVLMAYYVAPQHNQPGGTFHQTMVNSRQLCATPIGIPTVYNLKTYRQGDMATFNQLAEWLRDGLVRIVEVMGTDNIWYDEMVRLTRAMLAEAENRGGMFAAFRGHEPWGNILQTLARLRVLSGDDQYLVAAEQIADRLLLDPKQAVTRINYQDHGCELTPGLTELFVVESRLGRAKAAEYRSPLQHLLDQVLVDAAHPVTGLFCVKSQPDDRWLQPTDTWGYVLFGYENFDRACGTSRYQAAIEKPMRWLLNNRAEFDRHRNTLWPRAVSSDDWSDSYESMIVLWNRFPQPGDGFAWLDWATLQHIHRRHADDARGPYTGGHFDGSTGRTLCLHMMMCSQGARHVPFQAGVEVGAVRRDDQLLLSVQSDSGYHGAICFDGPRGTYGPLTMDWARINEMPQWWVVQPEREYSLQMGAQPAQVVSGQKLIAGVPIEVAAGTPLKIQVSRHMDR